MRYYDKQSDWTDNLPESVTGSFVQGASTLGGIAAANMLAGAVDTPLSVKRGDDSATRIAKVVGRSVLGAMLGRTLGSVPKAVIDQRVADRKADEAELKKIAMEKDKAIRKLYLDRAIAEIKENLDKDPEYMPLGYTKTSAVKTYNPLIYGGAFGLATGIPAAALGSRIGGLIDPEYALPGAAIGGIVGGLGGVAWGLHEANVRNSLIEDGSFPLFSSRWFVKGASAYLDFVADKLAEMGCEVQADPVNSPDEVYRRYGNQDVTGTSYTFESYLH